jgi:hypothetical protein
MTALLYRWPAAARFGRVVPKSKFYEHGAASIAIRERFVTDVQRIIWAYKLADTTINLSGTASVPEIQVFEIDAKDEDVSETVLGAIDRAVKSPVLFEINRGDGGNRQTRMVAAHKQLGGATPKLGAYYATDWQPADAARAPLPTAISLSGLYAALLERLVPVPARAGEAVTDLVARVETVRSLEREITALERKLRNEPQLNRKVDLRRALKAKQSALAELMRPAPSPASGNTN